MVISFGNTIRCLYSLHPWKSHFFIRDLISNRTVSIFISGWYSLSRTVLAVVGIIAFINLIRRNRKGIDLTWTFFILVLLIDSSEYVLGRFFEQFRGSWITFTWALIWLAYLHKSERVKSTYGLENANKSFFERLWYSLTGLKKK